MPLIHVSGFIDEEDLAECIEWLRELDPESALSRLDPPASLLPLLEHLNLWKEPT